MLVSRIGRKDRVGLFILLFLLCIFVAGCDWGGEEGYIAEDKVILDWPPDNAGMQDVEFVIFPNFIAEVTFQWHTEHLKSEVSYNYTLCIISGVFFSRSNYNPFNDRAAKKVLMGEETECIQRFSYGDFWNRWIIWGVRAEGSDGEIYESRVRGIYISPRDVKERVIMDYPPDGGWLPGDKTTFRWHLENNRDGITYNYSILFEKGGNLSPFESPEYSAETGEATEYTRYMSAGWWGVFKWCVIMQSSDGYVNITTGRWNGIKEEKVILDYPPFGSLSEGTITFRWHLENGRDGITYNYTILFDKGVDPFDGHLEYSDETGEATEYTIYMSAGWWASFEWGVTVRSSDGYVDNSTSRRVWIVE